MQIDWFDPNKKKPPSETLLMLRLQYNKPKDGLRRPFFVEAKWSTKRKMFVFETLPIVVTNKFLGNLSMEDFIVEAWCHWQDVAVVSNCISEEG